MKVTFFLIGILTSMFVIGQTTHNLDKVLWERVQNCYSLFEDMDEDGTPEYQKVDDAKNGYLKISGDWPTCGCSCSSTVGAYKDANSNYTFLQTEEFVCEWEKSLSSNRKMNEILPEDFGIDSFSRETTVEKPKYAVFFLDAKIPRIGTDTEFRLKLIPFGILIESNSLITYKYSQNHSEKEGWHSQAELLDEFKNVAGKIIDDKTLDFLLTKEYGSINHLDMEFLRQDIIGTGSVGKFESLDVLTKKLKLLKQVYDVYCQLEYMSILMKWNKEKARFEIKSRGNKPEKMSFKEFLLKNAFWGPIC